MNANLWLCATIVLAGLWSGLLLTVTTILHPMFAGQGAAGLQYDLGRFLPIARKSPTNYVLVIGLVAAPAGTLVALWDSRFDAPFVLCAIGLSLTFTGALLISALAAEPNYDVLLAEDPAHPSDRWPVARHRYFLLNWVRGAFVWTALGCFVSAAYLHWS